MCLLSQNNSSFKRDCRFSDHGRQSSNTKLTFAASHFRLPFIPVLDVDREKGESHEDPDSCHDDNDDKDCLVHPGLFDPSERPVFGRSGLVPPDLSTTLQMQSASHSRILPNTVLYGRAVSLWRQESTVVQVCGRSQQFIP